ncbi:hypothetical protein [Psychrobacter immobilis]|uniref:hypothetical protein n=1 Tax=Psychrobacter immobilis TaxID=498 RepID=UPI00191A576A|nr:hypothetical protein [Psychrobacter immobilis]
MALYNKEQLLEMDIPTDLRILLSNYDCCKSLLDEMESRFFGSDEDVSLFTHSYLNDEDKKDRDVMNNVSAINEVFKYISFIIETLNGDIVGYWHGLEKREMTASPIVLYDTEGQFNILNGSNLTEALVGNYLFDDDEEFLEYQRKFKLCGIDIVSKWDDLVKPKPKVLPEDIHQEIFKILNIP